jgi:hypothetical protein
MFARVASTVPETIAPTSEVRPPAAAQPVPSHRPKLIDSLVCLLYVAGGITISIGLWSHPATRALAHNVNDQTLIEWFLAHGVLFWTGDFSLVTDRLNAPDGVNLMSNASHILHGILMAPVTVLFGPGASFAALVALNLAGTAIAWYLLFSRTLRMHWAGAAVGAGLAGFGPGMISQSNSHLHITAQWLVPPIIWCLIRLTQVTSTRAIISTGLGLGLLVTAQAFLGEEVLFLTALALLIFIPGYALGRRAWARQVARSFLSGVAVGAALAVVLLAYPLWVQFAGPQHTPNAPFSPAVFYGDVASYLAVSSLSIGASPGAGKLATSLTEANAFFGPMLLLLVIVLIVWRRRSPATTAIGVTALLVTLLSFGPYVTWAGHRTDLPSLYWPLRHAPVITGALPTRYSLILLPLFGALLGYAITAAKGHRVPWVRFGVPIAIGAALLPLVPKPLAVTWRPPVPQFISSGHWRQCVPEGGVMVPVPLPTVMAPNAMRWAADQDDRFSMPEGFFLGPYGPGGLSSMGTWSQPTSKLLVTAANTSTVPTVSQLARAQATKDLAFWKADCVVVAESDPHAAVLRATLDKLLFAGTQVDDVWIWKID